MHRSRRIAATAAALVLCTYGITGSGADTNARLVTSAEQKVGNGAARVYASIAPDGRPLALGVALTEAALEGLPDHPDLTSRCFDKNGNGIIEPDECVGDHKYIFSLPAAAQKAFPPFKWIAVNWNPHGHSHPAPPPWAAPHFDFHFYIAPRESVQLLRTGKCGELIDCDDFKRAIRPVPPRYIHADHIDVGAAVPDMGNHLINSKSPELAPGGPAFTHTFIYGAYDGEITFLEPMVTRAYITSKPDMCEAIKQPEAWLTPGWYPTKYCVRHMAGGGRYTISLESFVKYPK